MSEADTGQVTPEAAELYEQFFVPALFDQWPPSLLDLAEVEVGHEVLDVACGTGILTRHARSRVGPTGRVVGLDVNPGMLAVAGRVDPEISWVPGRAESLPMASHTFDRVLCQFGLMFFEEPPTAVTEMARVVRPGGRVCVATWAGLSETPGYAAMIALLDELFGGAPAEALTAPFTVGTTDRLRDIVATGFADVEIHRLQGLARFSSIDAWVTTDVRAWTLRDLIDDEQFDELRRHAQQRLRVFCDESGAVTFAAPALVAVATHPLTH